MLKDAQKAAQASDNLVPELPTLSTGDGFQLLAGVKVLDLTTSVAGPYATMLLSDFGAEVIKVERPEGDDARHWGPPFVEGQALWFTAVNRNKRSIVLDLTRETDQDSFRKLVTEADILVINQPPNVQRKLGLDYESIRKLREDIVFVSITGFGLHGDRASLTCYDLIAEGYSGIMDITGEATGPAQKVGAPAADMLAGQDAAMAALAALYDRRQTGKGHCVDVSLVESMTRFLTCRISSYLGSGIVPARSGGTDSVIAIYQSFDTSDLPINLALGSDAIWSRFWDAVGDPGYGMRPEFSSNADRQTARPIIVAKIKAILATRPRAQWLALFAKNRIPAGPINRVDEVVNDPHLLDRQLFFALQDESGRSIPQIGLGIQIDGNTAQPRRLPPRLDEHGAEIKGTLN